MKLNITYKLMVLCEKNPCNKYNTRWEMYFIVAPPPICIAKNMTRDENRKHLYDIRGSLSNITFILIYDSYMSW